MKSSLQVVLQDAGYQTWLVSVDDLEAIGFEDDAAMGFACVFGDAATLLAKWRELETRLLTQHAHSLQRAGEKTWNIYSVFLCKEPATPVQFREVRWIEEDLERTRKITGCGLTSTSEVVTAMLPLLPLQYRPLLDSEDFDLTQRLVKRIGNIAPPPHTLRSTRRSCRLKSSGSSGSNHETSICGDGWVPGVPRQDPV